MATVLNNQWSSPQVATSRERTISGSFIPDTAADPSTIYGNGFSVVHTATGVWTVTIAHSFADFLSINVSLQMATADTGLHAMRVGGVSVANKTFAIVHLASANTTTTHPVAADIATSGTANRIHFSCTVAATSDAGAGL